MEQLVKQSFAADLPCLGSRLASCNVVHGEMVKQGSDLSSEGEQIGSWSTPLIAREAERRTRRWPRPSPMSPSPPRQGPFTPL